ncbi:MAG TPA: YitT family protein [Oscillospiraceae bacterium]|nr:YitT family protein [Oscillospiraceae bacterium]HPS35852.1 YitT family protein [Oscillospiraceae bacterium]
MDGSEKSAKIKNIVWDILGFLAGSFLMGFSVVYFAAPNNISIGGVTGISTMISYLSGGKFPIGITIIVLNIPLFVLAAFMLGKRLLFKSAVGMLSVSLMIDLLEFLKLPAYHGEMIVASLFAGAIGGVGLGLIFLRGGTTGGVDIIGRLIKLKHAHMEMGKLILMIEGVILIGTWLVYKNINNSLYSLITIYAYSRLTDTVLYGIDYGKSYFIISAKPREIAKEIMAKIGRGVTFLKGSGAYTDADKEIILTALRNSETSKVRAIIREIDPSAFIIVCSTSETIGEGFKSIRENK